MKNKFLLLLLCFTTIFSLIIPGISVNAEYTFETNYIYDSWRYPQKSIPAYELVETIDYTNMDNIPLSSIDDVFVSNGKIYLIDSVESRLNIFDENNKLIISVKLLKDKDNKIVVDPETNTQVILKNPEGVFVKEDIKEIYI